MPKAPKTSLRIGRLSRAMKLGGLAAGLASDAARAGAHLAASASKDIAADKLHKLAASRLAESLGGMKGLPMKLGQILSYVDDMIPAEHRATYKDALRMLRVKAQPMAWETLEKTIVEDLGAHPDELFAEFDRAPIAAASIGQVYRAKTKDGRDVAVKVQYPGVAQAIESDMKNVDAMLAALAVALPKVDLELTLQDVSARLSEEVDYQKELENHQAFERLWREDNDSLIPAAVPELCGERVFVSEFVEGMGWEEMLETASPEQKSRYGRAIFQFAFRSIYVHGIFNADPHPGNYMFLPDGRVAFIDFGCVQRYSHDTRTAFRRARDQIIEGAEASVIQKTLVEAYGLPDDLPEEIWSILQEYMRYSFSPITSAQPFRYTRAHTERITKLGMRAKMTWAKYVLKRGIIEAKQEGMVFMYRIDFGLSSILCALEAEDDWLALLHQIEAEASQLGQSQGAGG